MDKMDKMEAEKGWICPVCGRGVAPWARFCTCNIKYEVTCETSHGSDSISTKDYSDSDVGITVTSGAV